MTESKFAEYTGREVLLSKNENMSSNGSTPEAPKPESANSSGLKSLIAKGAVGAATLAGTTAIPLMVQKHFSAPPAPTPAVQVSPAQISPAVSPAAPPVESPVAFPVMSPVASPVAPLPSPLLPIQTQADPNQAGVMQIQLGTDQPHVQVEMGDEMNKKTVNRRKQRRDDDDDD